MPRSRRHRERGENPRFLRRGEEGRFAGHGGEIDGEERKGRRAAGPKASVLPPGAARAPEAVAARTAGTRDAGSAPAAGRGEEDRGPEAPGEPALTRSPRPFRRRVLRVLVAAALPALGACAQLRERLGRSRPPLGPVPVEVPTTSAFLGFDRVLRAPGEADGRLEIVRFPDSTGTRRVADGDSAVLLDLPGPAVIRRVRLSLKSADPHWLRRVALRMYWDGEENPSVAVPLGDFFAEGFERRAYASVPMGSGPSGFYSYLPMPFARRARIVLENGTGQPLEELSFDADVQSGAELAVPLATLHALWSRDARPRSTGRHVVADLRGAGWFVGTALSAQSYEGTLSFVDGNGSFRVDGRPYTGIPTAAYLGGGGAAAGPFAGVTLRDDARARLSAYRWHLPDPIPFRESLRLEIERGRANRGAADFATVAYWYQSEPHEPLPPLPFPSERRAPDVLLPADAQRVGDLEVVGMGAGSVRLTVSAPRPDLYAVVVYPEASPGSAAPSVQVRASRTPPRVLDVAPAGAEPGDLLPGVVVDTVAVTTRTVDLELTARRAGLPLPAAVHLAPVGPWADRWQVVGPWTYGAVSGAVAPTDFVWPPELDPAAADYPASGRSESGPIQPGGARLAWRPADADARGTLSFAQVLGPATGASAYAQTFLWSNDRRNATLVLTTDDAYQLWVGGLRVPPPAAPPSGSDEVEVPIQLLPGYNRILLEVAATGSWSVRMRVADPSGTLRWSRAPRDP